MSRLFVATDSGVPVVELMVDDDGEWSGVCWGHPGWVLCERNRRSLADAVEDAAGHVDRRHGG